MASARSHSTGGPTRNPVREKDAREDGHGKHPGPPWEPLRGDSSTSRQRGRPAV